jgi:hypothetical protein
VTRKAIPIQPPIMMCYLTTNLTSRAAISLCFILLIPAMFCSTGFLGRLRATSVFLLDGTCHPISFIQLFISQSINLTLPPEKFSTVLTKNSRALAPQTQTHLSKHLLPVTTRTAIAAEVGAKFHRPRNRTNRLYRQLASYDFMTSCYDHVLVWL